MRVGRGARGSARVFSLLLHSGGAVCLDVINQTWSPMYGELMVVKDSGGGAGRREPRRVRPLHEALTPRRADLVNVFETFLPQLLLYPNPADPLNGEAASLLMRDPQRYAARVREYVERFAKPGALAAPSRGGEAEGSDEEVGEWESSDDEAAGKMDE